MKREVSTYQRLDQNIGIIWTVYHILTTLYKVITLSASSHTVQIQVVCVKVKNELSKLH